MKVFPRLRPTITARRIGLNTVVLWVELGVNVLVMILLTRYLMAGIGKASYGLWSVAVNALEALMAIDLGMRLTTYRFLSQAMVGRSRPALYRMISSAAAIMLAVSAGLMVVMLAVGAMLPRMQAEITPAGAAELRQTLWILALALPFALVRYPFLGVLVGLQESYKVSVGRLGGQVTYAAAAAVVIALGLTDLRWIALAMLLNYIAGFALAAGMAWGALGRIPLRWRYVRRRHVAEMLRFSRGVFLVGLATMLMYNLDVPLIGAIVGAARGKTVAGELAATYRIPLMIILQARALTTGIANPLLAVAAQLQRRGEHDVLRELYRSSARILGALTMCVLLPLVVFGERFLTLWLPGQGLGWTWKLLAVLSLGQWVALTTSPGERMLMGAGRIRVSSLAFAAGAVLKILAAAAVLYVAARGEPTWGLMALAWATTVPLLIAQGVVLPAYVCRQNGLSLPAYLLATFGRLAAGGAATAAVLLGLRWLWTPRSLPEAVAQVAAGAAACLAICGLLTLTSRDRRSIRAMVARRQPTDAGTARRAATAQADAEGR